VIFQNEVEISGDPQARENKADIISIHEKVLSDLAKCSASMIGTLGPFLWRLSAESTSESLTQNQQSTSLLMGDIG